VELVEGEFDNETGNIAFRARFPNPEKLLRNGETGSVMMTVPLHKALVIPQKTTYEIQDKKYVFVVDKNNVIKSREITIKGEMPDLYVIESGITANDKIVFDGIQKANDNDKIKFDYLNPSKVLSSLKLRAE
jgi:membrane fusion protein (multidrug efflux system)